MRIFTHFSTEHLANVYVVSDDNGNGLIIDPSYIDKELLEIIENVRIDLKAVLLTHSHEGHTAGLGTLRKIYSFDIYAAASTIDGFEAHTLSDGESFTIGDLEIEALFVPGHSVDSLVYRIGSAIFTGDTLSSGTVASTRGYVAKSLLLKNIREKLMRLPDSTIVYPGHGPISNIRVERMFNIDLLEANGRF